MSDASRPRDDRITAHVLISGRVQGVAFRYSTRHMACSLSVDGWVRNLADGRVEACFQGPRSRVEQALAWCRKGPSLARVTEVEISYPEQSDRHEGFAITG